MDIAALILSIIALLMSVFVLVDILSQKKSSHVVQMVPVDSVLPGGSNAPGSYTPPGDEFTEFDLTDPAAMAVNEMKRKGK